MLSTTAGAAVLLRAAHAVALLVATFVVILMAALAVWLAATLVLAMALEMMSGMREVTLVNSEAGRLDMPGFVSVSTEQHLALANSSVPRHSVLATVLFYKTVALVDKMQLFVPDLSFPVPYASRMSRPCLRLFKEKDVLPHCLANFVRVSTSRRVRRVDNVGDLAQTGIVMVRIKPMLPLGRSQIVQASCPSACAPLTKRHPTYLVKNSWRNP